jgi:hypothetical protein
VALRIGTAVDLSAAKRQCRNPRRNHPRNIGGRQRGALAGFMRCNACWRCINAKNAAQSWRNKLFRNIMQFHVASADYMAYLHPMPRNKAPRKTEGKKMQDYQLTEYCRDIAEEIMRDAVDFQTALDWASEAADSSEYVIYFSKAHALCHNCNTENGEHFLDDLGAPEGGWSYDGMACAIAYGEILYRIQSAIFEAAKKAGEI